MFDHYPKFAFKFVFKFFEGVFNETIMKADIELETRDAKWKLG